ncbi:MAG: LacI family DNA-binding transcriptional regulator [Pseudomonadota bacterium]
MTSGSITIEDVAKAAGVSRQTVSRVINRRPNVRPVVRERVEQAINELGYVPNLAARRMGGNRSYLVLAALAQDSTGRTAGRLPLDEMLLAGMAACDPHGYHLLFVELQSNAADSEGDSGQQLARTLTALKPDGVILCPPLEDDEAVIKVLEQRGIAAAYLGERNEFGRVTPGLDDAALGDAAVRLLLEQGHRQIGFIAGLHDRARSERRLAGYRRALVAAGSRAHSHFAAETPLEFGAARELAEAWLGPTIRPSAIIAETEEVALAVIEAASASNVAIPRELSLLALEDQLGLARAKPDVSVIHQPYAEHFAQACKRLIEAQADTSEDNAAGEHIASIGDDFIVIERGSLAPAPRAV